MADGAPKVAEKGLGASMLDGAGSAVIFTGLTFITGVVIARLLGPVGRGEFGEIQYWAGLVTGLGCLSVFEGMIYYVREKKHDPDRLVSSFLLVGFGLAVLVSVVFLALYRFGLLKMGYHVETVVAVFMVLYIFSTFFSLTFVAVETSRLNFSLVVLERLAAPGVYTLLVLGVYLLDRGSVFIILVMLLVSAVPILLVRIWKFRHRLWRRPDTGAMLAVIGVGLRFHGSTALRGLSSQVDRLVVVSLWTSEMVGLYFVAYSAAGAAFAMLSQTLRMIVLPAFTGLDETHRARRLAKAIRMTMILSVAVAIAVFLAAPILIPLFFGPAFRPAVEYTQYLVFALGLSPLWIVLEAASRASGRGWPGIEMSIVHLAVFGLGFALTGYEKPEEMMIWFGLSQLLSIVAAMRHLVAEPMRVDLAEALRPRWADVEEIWHEASGRLRHLRARLRRSQA